METEHVICIAVALLATCQETCSFVNTRAATLRRPADLISVSNRPHYRNRFHGWFAKPEDSDDSSPFFFATETNATSSAAGAVAGAALVV